jgi:hypothetical protein
MFTYNNPVNGNLFYSISRCIANSKTNGVLIELINGEKTINGTWTKK